MARFQVIAFDGDDTLWHNEIMYTRTQAQFKEILSRYHPAEWIEERLYQTEMRNLAFYGYGTKSFALSMIETAIELSEGRITGREIQQIIGFAKEMLTAPVQLLDHVEPALKGLSNSHRLMLITKGDLLDQERKLAASNIRSYFREIEIVSDKTRDGYRSILAKYQIEPSQFLMVGNSLRSDVLPVLEIGGQAVHIPYHETWAHEVVEDWECAAPGCHTLEHIGLLPALIERVGAE